MTRPLKIIGHIEKFPFAAHSGEIPGRAIAILFSLLLKKKTYFSF
jgi:hypothetical protein